MAKLTFHGGALSVTGGNYLLETENTKILVDCGMFQGFREAEEENYEKFPYDPATIDAVFITHAHIDHIGRLPKLIKEGYKGPIYSTPPTADLAPIMLEDSQHLLASEAKNDKHEPLYEEKDVKLTAQQFKGVNYGKEIIVNKDIKVRLRDAGHILGSAIIEVYVTESGKEKKIIFSGDLGNSPTPLLNSIEYIEDADYVLVETVYGDRLHEDRAERKEILENSIEDVVNSGGTLMIPTFALERTQEILYEIHSLMDSKRIPSVPIFLDSPLAIKATEVYKKYKHNSKYFNPKTAEFMKDKHKKLFNFSNLKQTLSTEESKAINEVRGPKVIIAGSGMSTGGRIMHHERRYLSDPNSMLLIIGYQARNTLGRRLFDGVKEVKIYGEEVMVRAKIKAIGGYSAHADQKGLYDWIDNIRHGKRKLKKVFCIQGEEKSATAFSVLLRDNLALDAEVPKPDEVFEF